MLIRGSKASAQEARRFQFIDKSYRVIFSGDTALPLFIDHELVRSESVMAGAFPRSNAWSGTEESPVQVGTAVDSQCIAKRERNGPMRWWEIGRIKKLEAGSNLQAACTTDYDETPDS